MIIDQATRAFLQEVAKKSQLIEKHHYKRYGDAPHIDSLVVHDFKGDQLVLLGSMIISPKGPERRWNTPREVFLSVLIGTLGEEWLTDEFHKSNPHEIIRWFKHGNPNLSATVDQSWHRPNGKALAIIHLAYDIFVLQCLGKLEPRLIERLRVPDQFNGARYELFVFATLIRARFRLEYSDEVSGKNGKVPECKAIHQSGVELYVEAKTRNVKGILGAIEGNDKDRTYKLLHKTMKKEIKGPHVVFIDTNYEEMQAIEDNKKVLTVRDACIRFERENSNDLPNLICITNVPFHYGKDNEPPNDVTLGHYIMRRPKFELPGSLALDEIINSMKKFSNIPTKFNESVNLAEREMASQP